MLLWASQITRIRLVVMRNRRQAPRIRPHHPPTTRTHTFAHRFKSCCCFEVGWWSHRNDSCSCSLVQCNTPIRDIPEKIAEEDILIRLVTTYPYHFKYVLTFNVRRLKHVKQNKQEDPHPYGYRIIIICTHKTYSVCEWHRHTHTHRTPAQCTGIYHISSTYYSGGENVRSM